MFCHFLSSVVISSVMLCDVSCLDTAVVSCLMFLWCHIKSCRLFLCYGMSSHLLSSNLASLYSSHVTPCDCISHCEWDKAKSKEHDAKQKQMEVRFYLLEAFESGSSVAYGCRSLHGRRGWNACCKAKGTLKGFGSRSTMESECDRC